MAMEFMILPFPLIATKRLMIPVYHGALKELMNLPSPKMKIVNLASPPLKPTATLFIPLFMIPIILDYGHRDFHH